MAGIWDQALKSMQPTMGGTQRAADPGETGNIPYSPGMMQIPRPQTPSGLGPMRPQGMQQGRGQIAGPPPPGQYGAPSGIGRSQAPPQGSMQDGTMQMIIQQLIQSLIERAQQHKQQRISGGANPYAPGQGGGQQGRRSY